LLDHRPRRPGEELEVEAAARVRERRGALAPHVVDVGEDVLEELVRHRFTDFNEDFNEALGA